jgi:O-antigen/teichoic acid export membrane protein
LQAVAAFGVGATVLLTWPSTYLNTTYRTHAEFARLAINTTVGAAVGLLLVVLVRFYGFNGLVIRAILLSGVSLAILYYRQPMSVKPRWNTKSMIQLVKVGFPIYMVGQLYAFFTTLDRLVLVRQTEALGYYTLAIQVGAAARILPGSFGSVVYPRMAHRYGETGRASDLWRMGLRTGAAATLVGAGIGALIWIVVPALVRGFLPRYAPGIPAAQWAGLLGMAMGFFAPAHIFNVIKRQDLYIAGWIVGAAAFLLVFSLLSKIGGFARATSSAQAMLAGTLAAALAWTILAKYACAAHDRRLDHRVNEGPDEQQ